MRRIDHQRGALFGLAIGDALGAAVEFQVPGTFEPVTGYRDGGPHGLAPGEFTDDTSMALALADSIAEVGWDINDQAERYLKWWKTGAYSVNGRCFDSSDEAGYHPLSHCYCPMTLDPNAESPGNDPLPKRMLLTATATAGQHVGERSPSDVHVHR